jgi:hypothetical protein
MLGLGAQAQDPTPSVPSRLCFVQKQGRDGVYSQGLGQEEIEIDDYEAHIIYKDSNTIYQVRNTEGTGMITLAMFNPGNKNSLVIVTAGGDQSVTLINQPTKKLLSCTEVRK